MLKKSIGQDKDKGRGGEEGNEPMGRKIKISEIVFELLGDIGKKSETYSQVIEAIA